MIKLSLLSSDWIRLSEWETQQPDCSLTVDVLRYHQVRFIRQFLVIFSKYENKGNQKKYEKLTLFSFQKILDSILNAENTLADIPSWLPINIMAYVGQRVQIRTLFGADLLSAFVAHAAWADENVSSHPVRTFYTDHLTFKIPFENRLNI